MSLHHGSLFSGGGGFDLAAEVMGWTNVFHCETDPFCSRILNYYWPDAHSINNIREFNAKPFKGKIDILTGGFPCQPFSNAGQRRGTDDDRYLWPEMLRIIQETQPTWVIAENVYGIINWNEGVVFKQVHADLETIGFEVQAFVLPACGINAPHRRYRVWFVAYSRQNGQYRTKACNTEKKDSFDTYSNSKGLEGCTVNHCIKKGRSETFKQFTRLCKRGYWKTWPTQSAICGGDDGLPGELDGITLSKWKRETIKMYGNAIVPQVALQLFRTIQHISKQSAASRC